MDDYNFETLLNASVELLSPRNFFDKLLHNDTILTVGITGSDLNVKVAAKHYTLHDCARCCTSLEFLMFTLDLVYEWCAI